MEKVKITFYVPRELSERLERVIALYRLKKGKKLTKSEVIERALEKELEKIERELSE